MRAVFKREFRSYFTSPIGYAFLGIYFFLLSMFFRDKVLNYGVADFYGVFTSMFFIYLVTIPILTMRLLTDEKRFKTDQLLFTAPTGTLGIIMGKFLAAFSLLLIANSLMIVFALIVSSMTSMDWVAFIGGWLGCVLLGGALTAIGLLISCLTESQVVSAVVTFAVSLLIMNIDQLRSVGNTFGDKIIDFLSFGNRISSFLYGVLDYANIIFFLSIMAVFIFLTVRMQENKRWR